jgi:hypothetical protein
MSREHIPHDMSWSAFRMGNECPAAWHAKYVLKQYKTAPSAAMAVGVWFHAVAAGEPTAPIEAQFSDYLLTKSGKPTAQFQAAQECAARFMALPYIQAMHARYETEVCLTVDLGGATWLCYLDLIDVERKMIVDYKFTADMSREQWVPRLKLRGNIIASGHYAYQLAVYRAAAVAKYGGEPNEWMMADMLVSPVKLTDTVAGGPPPGSIIPRIETHVYAHHHLLDRYAGYMAESWEYARPSIFREPILTIPSFRQMRDGEVEPPRCGSCNWCVATQAEPFVKAYREDQEAD